MVVMVIKTPLGVFNKFDDVAFEKTKTFSIQNGRILACSIQWLHMGSYVWSWSAEYYLTFLVENKISCSIKYKTSKTSW